MNRWRVGEDRGSKEMDGCPLTGIWNSSILEDKDFTQELLLHLQETRKFVRAADIVDYIARPHVMACLKLTKSIFLAIAKHWMKYVGYCWTKMPSGQYVNRHERIDGVEYHFS
jgi:hypothetical protein